MEIEENGIYNAELILLKVLEADSLLAGIDETSNQLSILKDQISQVQVSIQELVSFEDAFKGQGGLAIRAFNQECHQPFLQFLDSWIDEYQSYLNSFIGSLKADALAHDILDARRIYMKDGVYTPEIREGLLQTIRKNRDLYPELFNK